MDDIILITGADRSGISLIAGVIQLCGAWGGQNARSSHISPSVKDNKRGSFENVEIRESIVKPFLQGIKADIFGQYPLPNLKICHSLADKVAFWWRQRVERIFRNQGYGGGSLFFVSAQSCLIWPIWASAFPQARWIIARRKDEDVVQSCIKTGFMRAYKKKEDWQKWIDVHKLRFKEMISAELNVWQIWPQRTIQGKFLELQQMIEMLGLQWNPIAVRDYIMPILWKQGVFEISE